MLNLLWLFLICCGIIFSLLTGNLNSLNQAIFQGTEESVQICLKLLGPMAFWLGIIKIAKESGLIKKITRGFSPIINRLFPDIPPDSEAAGAILLNLSANFFGLGNSSTPMGIKAMQELQLYNQKKKTASPAMCTLLALNTSSITVIPATVISLRAAAGSHEPAVITASTIVATCCSTTAALIADRFFRKFYRGNNNA
ncbi:MAG: nucleoside recognition domain-containing protein [Halanaerobiales bacterium]